jgi:predicted nucleotidyltransferase
MRIQELRERGLIIFECNAGSRAYNLSTPTSDVDTRGVFMLPRGDYLRVSPIPQQASDQKQDTIYYELRRYMELAADCNPNIIELLWTDESDIRLATPPMREILRQRDLFISKKAYHTFSGYAFSQIKKARGQNKLVYNAEPERRPLQVDYCWVIPSPYPDDGSRMPGRPIPLKELSLDLSQYHVAKVEHVPYAYRLYHYGAEARGVFRGEPEVSRILVTESIAIEDEWPRFRGFLIFNEDEYAQGVKRWENYWTWIKNRNETRWVSQEAGQVDYDLKNMMHCLRLLLSCESILTNGEPRVKFVGVDREFLMDVRRGKFAYEQLMGMVEEKMKMLEELYQTSTIRYEVDRGAIDGLFASVLEPRGRSEE